MEGQGRSRKVMEGQGRSFPITRLTFQVRKVGGGRVEWWPIGLIIVSAPVPIPFLWTLNFGFGTWIWDLDLGFGFGTGLGLDNRSGLNPKVIPKNPLVMIPLGAKALGARCLLLFKVFETFPKLGMKGETKKVS